MYVRTVLSVPGPLGHCHNLAVRVDVLSNLA